MSAHDDPVGDPWLEDPALDDTALDDPGLDDTAQRRVADLLAAEPVPPMPDDVADRLQAAIRAESAARATTSHHPAPASLDAHRGRRRRRLVTGLAAAAVVVGVVAVGGTVLTQPQAGNEMTADDAGAGNSAESAPGSAPESGDLQQAPVPPAARSRDVQVDDLADLPADALPPVSTVPAGGWTCRGGAVDAPTDQVRAVALRGTPVQVVRAGTDVLALRCEGVTDGEPAQQVETAELR